MTLFYRYPMRTALGVLVVCLLMLASKAEEPAKSVNRFGISCLKQTSGNSILSPWSLEQSLGMAYLGARGQTRAEMAAVLGFPLDVKADMGAFQRMSKMMADAEKAGAQTLQNANALFVSASLPLRPEWKEVATRDFSSEIESLDFSNHAAAKGKVDAWVNARTGGKIASVLPEDLPPDTVLALVNAIDLDIPWDERFTKELTHEAPFFIERAKSKPVPLMFKQQRMRYLRKPGFKIAALPYAGGKLQFVVILPDAVDGLAAAEAQLTPDLLVDCATLPLAEVRLTLPRFKMQPPASPMKEMLCSLGMKTAFESRADFGGISEKPLFISQVFHRAFIETDEDGTKAAAATATVLIPRNGFPHEVPHEDVVADHPFIFLVQDVQTGACLFIGRLSDPAPEVPAREAVRVPEPGARR
jgi:serpin B